MSNYYVLESGVVNGDDLPVEDITIYRNPENIGFMITVCIIIIIVIVLFCVVACVEPKEEFRGAYRTPGPSASGPIIPRKAYKSVILNKMPGADPRRFRDRNIRIITNTNRIIPIGTSRLIDNAEYVDEYNIGDIGPIADIIVDDEYIRKNGLECSLVDFQGKLVRLCVKKKNDSYMLNIPWFG